MPTVKGFPRSTAFLPGKAFLIAHLVEQDPAIRYTDAARLPINDINLLIASRYPDLQE